MTSRSSMKLMIRMIPRHFGQGQRRSDPEHVLPVEASVRHQDMAVGIESEEVAKGLDGNDGAGDGIPLRHRLLKKELQGFPGATTQIGKEIPVIEEVPAQDFRDAEDDMSVFPCNIFQSPPSKF